MNATKDLGHLGGHNGNNAMLPNEIIYFRDKLGVKSIVDIGCGPAWMVEFNNHMGIFSEGIEGDPRVEPKEYITFHDFTEGSFTPNKYYDLAYSVEFLEHVEERYIPNFMTVFDKVNYVFCTSAIPGQGGYHHVNEQPKMYWIQKFQEHGFEYDDKTFKEILEVSAVKNFVNKNGLFFRRKEPIIDIQYETPYTIPDAESKINYYLNFYVRVGGAV